MTRSRVPPKSRRTCSSPTSWNASAPWPARPAVTAKQPASFGAARLSGNDGLGPLQDLEAELRGLGGGAARCHGDKEFESAWAEGAALSIEEAIAYAQRGRGQRKRPSSGWGSLTPTERDVVQLVSEGLANNDIATRLFISPRTVQTHLTHVYTKLGSHLTCAACPGSGPARLTVGRRKIRGRICVGAASGANGPSVHGCFPCLRSAELVSNGQQRRRSGGVRCLGSRRRCAREGQVGGHGGSRDQQIDGPGAARLPSRRDDRCVDASVKPLPESPSNGSGSKVASARCRRS